MVESRDSNGRDQPNGSRGVGVHGKVGAKIPIKGSLGNQTDETDETGETDIKPGLRASRNNKKGALLQAGSRCLEVPECRGLVPSRGWELGLRGRRVRRWCHTKAPDPLPHSLSATYAPAKPIQVHPCQITPLLSSIPAAPGSKTS